MADVVRYVEWYVESLRDDLAEATWRLNVGADIPRVDLSAAPEVDKALRWMEDKWDGHRDRIADSLEVLVQTLNTVMRSFEEADEQLAAQLAGGASGTNSGVGTGFFGSAQTMLDDAIAKVL